MANCTGYGNSTRIQNHYGCSLPEGLVVFLATLNIFLSITASLGNALILIALRKVSSVHPPTKLLFRCLAITDLCVGLITQPLHVTYLLIPITKVNLSNLFYVDAVMNASGFLLCGVSISTATALSVDRLLALLLGLRYRHVVTLKRVFVVIIYFWVSSVSFVFVYIFWNYDVTLFEAAVLSIPCIVISMCSYAKIFLALRQNQAQVREGHQSQPNRGGIPFNIARYKKTVSSIAWVQLALAVCYVPFIICVITIRISGWSGLSADVVWECAFTLLYLNSSLNPILYCWRIQEIRQKTKGTIRQLCCSSS